MRCEATKQTHRVTKETLVAHRNAPLTPEGRRRLCQRVDAGRPVCHVAAEAGVARQTLAKWHARWLRGRRGRPAGPVVPAGALPAARPTRRSRTWSSICAGA